MNVLDPGALIGRAEEQTRIDDLLAGLRAGQHGALILRGDPGIGKTALLEYAARRARGIRVLRATGVQAEAELPFAGLNLLFAGFTDRLSTLPTPQRAALRRAFGMAEEHMTMDPFIVGVATRSMLVSLASAAPLLCVLDDAHWLDQASADALLFAARRLGNAPVGLLFGAREQEGFVVSGVPELRLGGLGRSDATKLLAGTVGELAASTRMRVLTEAEGNPLALLEFGRAFARERAAAATVARPVASPGGTEPSVQGVHAVSPGAPDLPQTTSCDPPGTGPHPVSARVERLFAERIRTLPVATRELLLIMAADGTGNAGAVLSAARASGVSPEASEPAEQAGLIETPRPDDPLGSGVQLDPDGSSRSGAAGARLRFTHPLIGSAVYQIATSVRRRSAHRALAAAYDGYGYRARSSWHLAAATVEPDESVAAALEQTAEEARYRGGYATVAVAYERAARLTSHPGHRARRLVAAAESARRSGRPENALALIDQVPTPIADPEVRGKLALLRATLGYEQNVPGANAELVRVAALISDHAPETAALLMFDAVMAMLGHGEHASIVEAERLVTDLRPSSTLLAGAINVVVGLSTGPPRRGMSALRDLLTEHHRTSDDLTERVSLLPGYLLLADVNGAHAAASALFRDCRATGAVGLLPRITVQLGRALLLLGRYSEAVTVVSEGLRIAEDTDQRHFTGHLTGLLAAVAAVRGDIDGCQSQLDTTTAGTVTEDGLEGLYAATVLDLGQGRPEAAYARLRDILYGPNRHLALSPLCAPEFVEAAVRTGHHDRAAELCAGLQTRADATGEPWPQAVALRSQAIAEDADDRAEELFEQAAALHELGGPPFEQARTELSFGDWLRRRRRRAEARRWLRSAVLRFDRLGAAPWAERAAVELRATGETPHRSRTGTITATPTNTCQPSGTSTASASTTLSTLTAQETTVARLAAAGLSNRDIGARLHLSPRTVGYHLSKAYPKLGISSRHELARLNLLTEPEHSRVHELGAGVDTPAPDRTGRAPAHGQTPVR